MRLVAFDNAGLPHIVLHGITGQPVALMDRVRRSHDHAWARRISDLASTVAQR